MSGTLALSADLLLPSPGMGSVNSPSDAEGERSFSPSSGKTRLESFHLELGNTCILPPMLLLFSFFILFKVGFTHRG